MWLATYRSTLSIHTSQKSGPQVTHDSRNHERAISHHGSCGFYQCENCINGSFLASVGKFPQECLFLAIIGLSKKSFKRFPVQKFVPGFWLVLHKNISSVQYVTERDSAVHQQGAHKSVWLLRKISDSQASARCGSSWRTAVSSRVGLALCGGETHKSQRHT